MWVFEDVGPCAVQGLHILAGLANHKRHDTSLAVNMRELRVSFSYLLLLFTNHAHTNSQVQIPTTMLTARMNELHIHLEKWGQASTVGVA